MKRERLLTLLGSVCLAVMLLVPLAVSCGPATPEEAAEEIAALESKLATEKSKVSSLQGDVSDLEAEIAELRAPAEVFNWKFTSWSSPGSYYGDTAYPAFCQQIQDMSGGRITVEYIGAGALAPGTGAFDCVRTGLVEIGCPAAPHYTGVVVENNIAYGLPFGLRDPREVLTLDWERGFEELLREAYLELDPPVYYLAPDIWAAVYLVTSSPVTSMEELRDLKVRAVGSPAKYLEKLGVTTVVLAYEEIYTGIATGTVDGELGMGISECYDMKIYEFAKYILEPPLIAAGEGGHYMVNMDAWNSLSENLQAIIYGAAQAAAGKAGVVGWTDYEVKAEAKVRELGATRTQMNEAGLTVLVEKAGVLWDEVAAISPRNAEMMEIYKQYMKDLGYID